MQKNLRHGRPTPLAVFTGVHPAVELGCLSFTGIDVDEFTIAGAMLGEPLELAKCETIDLEVPAWAEIVLECEIHPTEREPEAPFGEYPGTYGPQRNNPVVYVKAITMRRNAHYHSSFVGHRDNLLLSGVTRNSQIYRSRGRPGGPGRALREGVAAGPPRLTAIRPGGRVETLTVPIPGAGEPRRGGRAAGRARWRRQGAGGRAEPGAAAGVPAGRLGGAGRPEPGARWTTSTRRATAWSSAR